MDVGVILLWYNELPTAWKFLAGGALAFAAALSFLKLVLEIWKLWPRKGEAQGSTPTRAASASGPDASAGTASRAPPSLRIGVFLLSAAALLVAVAVFVTFAVDVSIKPGSLTLFPKNGREIEGRGFYRDLTGKNASGERNYYVTFEDMKLVVYESDDVRGVSYGPVQDPSQGDTVMIRKDFSQIGYMVNGFLFLSYRITREEGGKYIPTGVGSYALKQARTTYTGEVLMRDSDNDTTLSCPYVLSTASTDQKLDDVEALKRWPMLGCGCREVNVDLQRRPPTVPPDACS